MFEYTYANKMVNAIGSGKLFHYILALITE